jgi:two-component system, NtrC family, response regulator GlrR
MILEATKLIEEKKPGVLSMPAVRLVVLRGPDRGRSARLEREELTVGTTASADLVLTDPTVSRNHFTLRVSPGGYFITDLDSTNGTLIEGRRVVSAYLAAGERLEAGHSELRLEALGKRVDLAMSLADAFGGLAGRSLVMKRVFALLEAVAKTDTTVLIGGETGTGKDVAAESLHELGPRAQGPFVVVDCSAIPSGLIESELFGHERGAFTDARERRIGAFEEASGGTLFLDEIGELPRPMQTRLLRAIEEREVRRVGGGKPISVDVRIIAATNRDLKLDVNRGLFREDLYYRLNVVAVRMPPLRERPEDIPLLAERFRRELSGDPQGALPDVVLESLMAHSWPGNVRELRNRIERLTTLGGHDYDAPPPVEGAAAGEGPFHDAKQRVVDTFERTFLTALLARARGNVSEAARLSSLNRVYLSRLLRKHGLTAR